MVADQSVNICECVWCHTYGLHPGVSLPICMCVCVCVCVSPWSTMTVCFCGCVAVHESSEGMRSYDWPSRHSALVSLPSSLSVLWLCNLNALCPALTWKPVTQYYYTQPMINRHLFLVLVKFQTAPLTAVSLIASIFVFLLFGQSAFDVWDTSWDHNWWTAEQMEKNSRGQKKPATKATTEDKRRLIDVGNDTFSLQVK